LGRPIRDGLARTRSTRQCGTDSRYSATLLPVICECLCDYRVREFQSLVQHGQLASAAVGCAREMYLSGNMWLFTGNELDYRARPPARVAGTPDVVSREIHHVKSENM